jgi:acetyl coenzyme A synthetase (ADP forming)-like protein
MAATDRSATAERTAVDGLRALFAPRAVAVIGVSRDKAGFGRRVFDNLLAGGFRGPVYAVNPHAPEIAGIAGHRAYRSIKDLPAGVECAIVAVPADAVHGVLAESAAAGIKALVIISAGFAEAGAAGRQQQDGLLAEARAHGVRLVGPNCMGVLNTHPSVRLNATFAGRLPPHGHIAVASQSGGLGITLLEIADERQVGLSAFVSLGNKADVSGNDFLQYADADPATSVILLYLESFGNPRRFSELARAIGRRKPIVAVKAGRGEAGTRAAGSHTAGLATSDVAVDTLFHQCGVVRTDTIDEMFDVAACLDLQPLPAGRRVAIVTNTGGPGILAADACEAAGLSVPELSAATISALATCLPPHASLRNPVDLLASAGPAEYSHAVRTVLAAKDVDALIVIYTPIDHALSREVLDGVAAGVISDRADQARLSNGAAGKPVLACTYRVAAQPMPLQAGAERIPTYTFPESAVRALGRASAYAAWRAAPQGKPPAFDAVYPEEARTLCREVAAARGDTWLTAEELSRVLNAFGLPLAPKAMVRSEDEAAATASIIGFPVVLKIDAPGVLHKTEAGGVRLNLTTERAVQAAFRDIAERYPEVRQPGAAGAVFVQPMLTGVETIVGLTEDATFGPLVAFGFGGIDTEVHHDVAFRLAPLTDREADTLIQSVRCYPLLQGRRGRPPADLQALSDVILRVSLLGDCIPEVRELDLNPVIALPAGHGCRVVDARARVGPAIRQVPAA